MIGLTKTATTTVALDKNTALAVGSGALPVFGTPMMVALMEEAACLCMAELYTDKGQTCVGTAISVAHTAPTPVGQQVTATATMTGIEGRQVTFDLTAHDEKGLIGTGTHTRFMVDEAKFMAKLNP